jgi:hypothetical protein
MSEKIEYRNSDYFNENSDFLFKTNFDRWIVSKVHFYNGAWYTNESLKYKATTIKCIILD